MKRRYTLADALCALALALALFVFLGPVLWMVITAVKPPGEWLNSPPVFIPSELHWANFTDALFKWGGLKGLERQPDRLVAVHAPVAASGCACRLRDRKVPHGWRQSVLHRSQHSFHAAGRGGDPNVPALVMARSAR